MTKSAARATQPAPRSARQWASRLREWAPVALAALLLVLLAVLAAMQHHWLGRASEADLQRTSTSLQAAAHRFSADFNRELGDLLGELVPVLFRGPDSPEIVAAVDRWRQRANWPELVRGVWQISVDDEGTTVRPLTLEDGKEPTRDTLADDAMPEELSQLAKLLEQRVARQQAEPSQNRFLEHPRVLMAEVPAIVIPQPGVAGHGRHVRSARQVGPDDRSQRRRHWRQWLAGSGDEATTVWVIHLDAEVIRRQILPELAQRHFSTEAELGLRVSDLDGGLVWTSLGSGQVGLDDSGRAAGEPVARAELFGPFRPPGDHGPKGGADGGFGGRRGRGLYAPAHNVLAAAAGVDRGQWTLEVIHPAGSLDDAVAAARHRSLALSFVILLVLAGSILLLAHGARRAQALARKQMEFVAGVTHELRTPVAALRSAGQNLADGVVKPERVKTYGELVDREGRRLESAVDQILAFAGLSAGSADGQSLAREALDPVAAVKQAVADLSPLLQDQSVEVDIGHPENVPSVLADAESLRRALRNLIQNAALHGRSGPEGRGWVGVDIEARDGRVLFHVRDRGPGVDPADRKRIFEPFVRGTGLAASNVPGSGLGLALVRQVAEALNGSVTLSQTDQDGQQTTTFTLALPSS